MSYGWHEPKEDEHAEVLAYTKKRTGEDIVLCIVTDIFFIACIAAGVFVMLRMSWRGVILSAVFALAAIMFTWLVISSNKSGYVKAKKYSVLSGTVKDKKVSAGYRRATHYVSVDADNGKEYRVKVPSDMYVKAAPGRRALVVRYEGKNDKSRPSWDLVLRSNQDED